METAARLPHLISRPRQTSQVNVRISQALKDEGDAAFAAAGITPSEAIRMLYEFAAEHKQRPQAIRKALSPAEEDPHRLEEQRVKAERFSDAQQIVPNFLSKRGIARPHPEIIDMPYKRLRELSYAEKYGIRV